MVGVSTVAAAIVTCSSTIRSSLVRYIHSPQDVATALPLYRHGQTPFQSPTTVTANSEMSLDYLLACVPYSEAMGLCRHVQKTVNFFRQAVNVRLCHAVKTIGPLSDALCGVRDIQIALRTPYSNVVVAHISTRKTSQRNTTSSSAAAERPREPLSQLKSCQLLHNCTTKNHI